jgi:uncharacterized membrane protein YfcA
MNLIHHRPARGALAFISGGVIAVLSGLMGLGGAEFRLPVLIGALGFAVRQAVPLNLLVSLATILVSLVARATLAPPVPVSGLAVEIAAVMAGAVTAAWAGTGLFRRLADHTLERVVGILLLTIAAVLLVEAAMPVGLSAGLPGDAVLRAIVGMAAGLAIGMVSSLLGVAGGELIIPTMVLAFGADIKAAGTASLIISLPTVLVGVVRYARQGAYGNRTALSSVAAPMAVGSVLGATLGATLVGLVPSGALKVILGVILAVSALKMLRHRRVADRVRAQAGKPASGTIDC